MKQGFTLIEVVVSVTVLLVAGVSISRLMARTENTASIARQEFLALNVAREGLELVRDLRDNNWFTQDPDVYWAKNICEDKDDTSSFTIDSAILRTGNTVTDGKKNLLYVQKNGEWTHNSAGTETGFGRSISVDCSHSVADESQEPEKQIEYITVTSHVTWKDHGRDRTTDVKEKLYNWLQFKQAK